MVDLVARRGLAGSVSVDSCGTGDYHAGQGAHQGSVEVAAAHGLDLSGHRARQFDGGVDFAAFDWLVCMDTSNRNGIAHLDGGGSQGERIVLLLDYARGDSPRDVPDPYYGGGFENVFQLIEDGCTGLLDTLLASGR